jgi:signal peptidase
MRRYSLLAVAVALGVLVRGVAYAAERTGFQTYSVLSESMAPSYRSGDLVVTQRRSPVDYRVGEALVYRSAVQSAPYILHRLVNREYQNGTPIFSMRGDAVTQGDPLITAGAIVGAARLRVPYGGFVLQVLASRLALILRVLSLSGCIIYLFFIMRHEARR